MRLRFWQWAHDRAEALWHWIYYNRIPDGIAERKRQHDIYAGVNNAYHHFWVEWINSKGEKVPAPIGYASGGDVAHIKFNGGE